MLFLNLNRNVTIERKTLTLRMNTSNACKIRCNSKSLKWKLTTLIQSVIQNFLIYIKSNLLYLATAPKLNLTIELVTTTADGFGESRIVFKVVFWMIGKFKIWNINCYWILLTKLLLIVCGFLSHWIFHSYGDFTISEGLQILNYTHHTWSFEQWGFFSVPHLW